MITTRFASALVLALVVACKSDSSGPEASDNVEPLNFQEEQLLGVWYRYHAYDGSEEYIIFRADRTACDWEEPNGSSTKTDYGEWTWSIAGSATSHPYTVLTNGRGINYTFDYPAGELWPGSFSNLVYYKSGSSKTCD